MKTNIMSGGSGGVLIKCVAQTTPYTFNRMDCKQYFTLMCKSYKQWVDHNTDMLIYYDS